MGLKKKKNVIVISACAAFSFIVYQLYFFFTITSETGYVPASSHRILYAAVDVNGNRVIPVLDPDGINEDEDIVRFRSEDDKYINDAGLIRGVLFSHMARYKADSKNNFECFESGKSIPIEFVNDDYCDCEDASDEPSTNACVNGTFYCDFQYFKKVATLNSVPSSKVNDGICDCCDGSDEFDGRLQLLSQSKQVGRYNARHTVDDCPNIC